MDTCGRGNFWIRNEIVADSKISGYVWRGLEWTLEWLAIQWAFAKWYSSIWPSCTKSLLVSGTSINSKCTNDTYVKARPKMMAAVIFRDTATNRFHWQRRLLALFHVFYTTTWSSWSFRENEHFKKKTVSIMNYDSFKKRWVKIRWITSHAPYYLHCLVCRLFQGS